MSRRLNILLGAYYCSPYQGSESAVGWNIASRLALKHDVTVLCGDLSGNEPTKKDLDKWSSENGLPPGMTVQHVAPTAIVRILHDLHKIPGLWFTYYLAYSLWQNLAYKRAIKLNESKKYDLVHQLTIIGYRMPGKLWQLGLPFFWGPITGACGIPADYLKKFGLREKLRWNLRETVNRNQRKGSPRCKQAAAHASMIWSVSREDQEMVQSWGYDATPLLETGAKAPRLDRAARKMNYDSVRLVWSGLFQGIKALPILLEALAETPENHRFQLDVLGQGPEKEIWLTEMGRLGISKLVRFHGFVTHEKAMQIMDQADILIHTSVKEGTPHVVLEALSMGMPVICHDACGMGIAVNESCGIKVPLIDTKTSVKGFREAIQRLADDSELYAKLSQGALKRAEELGWENIILKFEEAYYTCTILNNKR